MRNLLALALLASALGGCGTLPTGDDPRTGMIPVKTPVIERQDYVFDASTPDGYLAPSEAARLDAWFRNLELSYGDKIYVDGPFGDAVSAEVARVAGQFGMLVTAGAPATGGTIASGSTRVVVSRNRAVVLGCPDWSEPSQPNYQNRMMSNFGCAVNSNLAAMVANPNDLIHGQEASGLVDVMTGTKAVHSYRSAKPTGEAGLSDIKTKGSK